MSIHDYQASFNGGEVSDLIDGQIGLDKYRAGCQVMKNFIARTYGPAFARPGTLFVGETKYPDKATRVEGFSYSTDTTFILEVGHLYIRFWSNGVQVVDTSGNPVEVATPWTEDEIFDVQFGAQVNDLIFLTHPDHEPRRLVRNSDTDWDLETVPWEFPPLRDANVRPALTLAASATTGNVTLTAAAPAWAPSTSYTMGDIVLAPDGKFLEARLNHTSGATIAGELSLNRWKEIVVFGEDNVGGWFALTHTQDAAFVTDPVTGTSTTAAIRVRGAYTLYTYGVIDADIAIERSYTGAFTGEEETIYKAPLRGDRNINYQGDQDDVAWLRIRIPYWASSSSNPQATLEAADANVTGLVRITGWNSTSEVTGTVEAPIHSTKTTNRWAESSWSPRRGWPRAVAFHEQRLVYAGVRAEPEFVWGSKIGDFYEFRLGVDDDDAFAFPLAATRGHPVNWLSSFQALLIGTEGEEWTLEGGTGEALTPANRTARRQSTYGSQYIQPIATGDALLFMQRTGHKLRELMFDFAVKNGWKAQDLTILSDHLFRSPIRQTAVQGQADVIVWMVREDGKMVGLTYERDQNVVAFHQHDTDGEFRSVATVYGRGDEWDHVYVVARRTTSTGTRQYIERLDPAFFSKLEAGEQDEMVYSDSAVVVRLGSPSNTISGLDHLNGRVVNVLADGAAHAKRLVSDGVITLSRVASTVVAGLDYESILQPTRREVIFQDGSAQGRNFRVNRVTIRLWRSLGVSVSHDADAQEWHDLTFRTTRTPMGSPPPLFTGDIDAVIEAPHGPATSVAIRRTGPLPANVVALTTKFSVTGS